MFVKKYTMSHTQTSTGSGTLSFSITDEFAWRRTTSNVSVDTRRVILVIVVVRYRWWADVGLRRFPTRWCSYSMNWCRWSSPEECVSNSTWDSYLTRHWSLEREHVANSSRPCRSVLSLMRPSTMVDCAVAFECCSPVEGSNWCEYSRDVGWPNGRVAWSSCSPDEVVSDVSDRKSRIFSSRLTRRSKEFVRSASACVRTNQFSFESTYQQLSRVGSIACSTLGLHWDRLISFECIGISRVLSTGTVRFAIERAFLPWREASMFGRARTSCHGFDNKLNFIRCRARRTCRRGFVTPIPSCKLISGVLVAPFTWRGPEEAMGFQLRQETTNRIATSRGEWIPRRLKTTIALRTSQSPIRQTRRAIVEVMMMMTSRCLLQLFPSLTLGVND